MTLRQLVVSVTAWFRRSARPSAAEAAGVLDRHATDLMRRDGVTSVGIGLTDDGRTAIVVGLTGSRASGPGLPEEIEGVPVLARDLGPVRARAARPR